MRFSYYLIIWEEDGEEKSDVVLFPTGKDAFNDFKVQHPNGKIKSIKEI